MENKLDVHKQDQDLPKVMDLEETTKEKDVSSAEKMAILLVSVLMEMVVIVEGEEVAEEEEEDKTVDPEMISVLVKTVATEITSTTEGRDRTLAHQDQTGEEVQAAVGA